MVFNWFNRKSGKGEDKEKKENEKKQSQSLESESPQTQAKSSEVETDQSSKQTTQEDYLKWAKAAYQNIQQRQEKIKAEEKSSEFSEETKSQQTSTPVETDREETIVEDITETVAEKETSTPVETDREEVIVEDITETIAEEETSTPIETDREEVIVEDITETIAEEETSTPIETDREEVIVEDITETVEEEISIPVGTDNREDIGETIVEKENNTSVELEKIADTDTEIGELSATDETAIETPETIQETPSEPISTPAWMQKSDALERLKETAIETPESEIESESSLDFDEDFVWSAKVLAEQGRRPEEVSLDEISWLKRLREGLGKTRRSLINQLKAVVGQGPLNEDAVMEIEALLLQADVGVEATEYIIETLQEKLREEALPPEEAIAYLKTILCDLLDKPLKDPQNAALTPQDDVLNIWLMTGVNGAGKTTTIGKLAHMAKQSGYSCIIAAADTFRAAAVEQVTIWGARSQTQVIANPGKNTDPAAVVYDAINAAISRDIRLLLVDTAGRLQNKKNLMAELAKIRRIIDKKAPNATVESLLVLDATLGQNGLRQAQVFSESAKLSGVVLTKLDGSAKGGVALAVAKQLNLPICFVGAGEGIEDLRPFSSYEFVEALLSD
ncbi:signal recognition particle-docking protein FtsY [Spirulina sp. 06S082]|uniref:signal recognition particle-docking protein FtsY n=1 Tax=Spirulina sp. 06S082 TaxID=3110248 RepID=UPI002B1F246A|nr:signal recognition particle-docking protein FtsY [Spirulina sp. 06S082]MEA5470310.1 signal recognition particle-docking protein FtsY [Spirulina sp. 06S082]